MKIKILNTFSDELHSEWSALLQNSPTNVPFLKYGYLKLWWQSLGGGEWDNGEPFIILGYEQQHLVGIAPFFKTQQNGQTILTLIGSKEISDYLDLIIERDEYEKFLTAVLDHLINDVLETWDQIILNNLRESSPMLEILRQEQTPENISCHIEKDLPAPYLTLPNNWEKYLESIQKKQRHEIRRKMRRLEQEAGTYRFFFADNDIEHYGKEFLALMQEDPVKKDFLTPAMAVHMQNLLSWSHQEGILKLCFLEINGILSAGYFCFDDQNTIYIYNSGFHYESQYFSPGWVLLSYLIQWAIQNTRTTIDFMRGDETYKYRFGAVDSFVYTVNLTKK